MRTWCHYSSWKEIERLSRDVVAPAEAFVNIRQGIQECGCALPTSC
jgi:hypothetical protein